MASVSLVISWRFLERLPLLTIMAKDNQGHLFTLDQVQELARAGAQLLLIVIARPGLSIRGKVAAFTPILIDLPPINSNNFLYRSGVQAVRVDRARRDMVRRARVE